MVTTGREWTVDEVLALPDDGNRYELIDGELFVTPSPRLVHQAAVREIVRRLEPYVRAHRLGHLFFAPADIRFGPRTLVQPDVFVVPWSVRPPVSWSDITQFLLAVEVLSPGTARADRLRKRTLYQRRSVPEYWIVDSDACFVERWRPSDDRPEVLADTLEWHPAGGTPALVIDLPSFFRDVLGGDRSE